ncbi:hypothetical protein F5X99DRAFT_406916 [Biscogniauxia marginata]|nr:hypothetical protein F5X99DRAFT_406916 [Biscogniauxia marginata]
MDPVKLFRLSTTLLLLSAVGVLAADDENELFLNIFSDIGPILALFGDRFAQQFLGESFTVFDHLIFACVPLGIITAIAGAIRVQGPKFTRAFIGRARENRAAAEIEFMSSTSAEVCELFSASGIVRTIGRPTIAQLVFFPEKPNTGIPDDDSCGIHTLQTAVGLEKGIVDPQNTVMVRREYRSKYAIRLPRAQNIDPESCSGSDANNNPDGASGGSLEFLGPPNLQLNIPPGRISHKQLAAELILATVIAVILQLSLFVIAVVTVQHQETRASISYDPQPWGLPCYISGSVLLSIGMFLCSFAIEKSTVEFLWEPKEHDQNSFRLFWVQRSQQVNDQEFDSYVVLGGLKDYILTSSRQADVLEKQQTDLREKQHQRERWFKVLTSVGALAGGLGFTTQFIGLRGLPWPCAVSQLGAILAMAVIRALIRRRLGRAPPTCQALPKHELDFLAIQLVFGDKFGGFESTGVINGTLKDQTPDKVCSWEVKTARDLEKKPPSPNPNTPRPSEQLVRVRKRLGILYPWTNSASKPAAALANTIEMFMRTFLRNTKGTVEWSIPITRNDIICQNSQNNKEPISDVVKLLIKNESSRWIVDSGEIESVLSLWIASILAQERKRSEKDENINYSRILGYETDVLVRDIEWWTPWTNDERGRSSTTDSPFMDIKLEIGFPKSPNENLPARASGKLLIHDSSADLATICAQHLFTSFIWAVTEQGVNDQTTAKQALAEDVPSKHAPAQDASTEQAATNQNVSRFLLPANFLHQGDVDIRNYVKLQLLGPLDLQSPKKPGRGLKLSHTILTNVASYGERAGLGTSGDILLCVIPVFSLKDRLPNEIVLDQPLPKDILGKTRQDWVKLTPRYIELLDKTENLIAAKTECFLALTAVVSTMEFIYLLALDYAKSEIRPKDLENEQMNTETGGERPYGQTKGLDKQLKKLLVKIFRKFPGILEKFLPIYELQQRKEAFNNIFCLCAEVKDQADKLWGKMTRDKIFLDRIGFRSLHQQICDQAKNNEIFLDLTVEGCHESCVDLLLGGPFKKIQEKIEPDGWGRGPVHIVATSQNSRIADQLLTIFKPEQVNRLSGRTVFSYLDEKEPKQNAIGRMFLKKWRDVKVKDNDGKTVLHHAIRFLNDNEMEGLFKNPGVDMATIVDNKDNKGRTPLHLAVTSKKGALAKALIKHGAMPSARNSNGQTPLMLACQHSQKEVVLAMLKAERRWDNGDRAGKTALHYAVQSSSDSFQDHEEIIEGLIRGIRTVDIKARNGETPLHSALIAGNASVSLLLLEKKADPKTKDEDGKNALHHFAESKGLDSQLASAGATGPSAKAGLDQIWDIMRNSFNDNEFPQTVLHSAIQKGNDNTALFLSERCDSQIRDSHGRTPLIVACELGKCPKFIEKIVTEKDKELVNEGDSYFGESALARACGTGHADIVNILLKAQSVDPNRQATKYRGYTPLHIALTEGKEEIVGLLLDDHRINASLDIADKRGDKPLQFAIKNSNDACLKVLLLKAGSDRFSDPELDGLIRWLSSSKVEKVVWDALGKRLLHSKQARETRLSLHRLAEAGQEDILFLLLDNSDVYDLNELDEDGWTPADVAGKHGHPELEEKLEKHPKFRIRDANTKPYPQPSTFAFDSEDANAEFHGCDLHQSCKGSVIGQCLLKNYPPMTTTNTLCLEANITLKTWVHDLYIRAQECIPPNIVYFYFEVEFLRCPETKICAVGFCPASIPDDSFLGWNPGSWAYRGDNGGLYMESDRPHIKDADQRYGEGDVVGCGLNVQTGEGYYTLNSKILDPRGAFDNHKFRRGKMYPCIAWMARTRKDVLHVRVTFRESEEHQFKYRGSYV